MLKVVLITSLVVLLLLFIRYNKKQARHLREKRNEILKRLRDRE